MPPDAAAPTVVTATAFETRAARRALPAEVRVARAGVGARERSFEGPVVVCGLAGGVRRDLPTGTVVVPAEIVHPDGSRRACDERLVALLIDGARRLGIEPVTLALATSATLVRGPERERYAALGFAAVDMETAFIQAPRIAAVRVILDTPQRELSPAWLRPLQPLVTPSALRELPWLMREGPRCAKLAAAVVAASLSMRRVRDEDGDGAFADDPFRDAP